MGDLKLDYGKTFVLGLGFFAISISWSVYNAFVPVFLKKFIDSAFWIGLIMTLDNIAAVTVQPYFGALSDRTWTRFGRRMPYLLIGIPASAVLMALIPFHTGLAGLLVVVVLFNIAMTIYRAPTVALMPDLTPSPLRSKANGIINFMGGLGALLAFFVGAALYDLDKRAPFAFASILMLAAAVTLFFAVKERRGEVAVEDKPGIIQSILAMYRESDRSLAAMLGAIFFWFLGYAGIEAFFTLYGKVYLGIKESAAALTLGFLSVAFLLVAIPAGFLGTRLGRRRTISAGIIGMILVFLCLQFLHGLAAIVPALPELWVLRVFMFLAGVCWSLININSYPMVVDMTTNEHIGTYTGLYYLSSSLAMILGPWLTGGLIDLANRILRSDSAGYGYIFLFGFVTFCLALLCISGVRRGEARTRTEA
ncbi:MAG: MFS transporter [Firmicutes bacterium]|nr:MFS transporter [Bacillota bacterium]